MGFHLTSFSSGVFEDTRIISIQTLSNFNLKRGRGKPAYHPIYVRIYQADEWITLIWVGDV